MPSRSKVTPKPKSISDNAPPSYKSYRDDHLSSFQRYITNEFGCDPAAFKDAATVAVTQKVAYQIELWTLTERRWVEWKDKPYQDEPLRGRPVGHIFNDHKFDLPPTIIEGKQTTKRDLLICEIATECETCHGTGNYDCSTCVGVGRGECTRCFHSGYHENGSICTTCHGVGTVRCDTCQGRGKKNCDQCGTQGQVLRWPVINVEWNTVYSVDFVQNTFLPLKKIPKAGGKQNFYSNDQPWNKTNNLSSCANLYAQIAQCPVQFQAIINDQYVKNHLNEMRDDTNIARMQCKIDQIPILEIDYKSPYYVNRTERATKGDHIFTFLQYGSDSEGLPQFYEQGYPSNCCGKKCATQDALFAVL